MNIAITQLLSWATLLGDILILVIIIYWLATNNQAGPNIIRHFLHKYGLELAWLVAIAATLGSLYFSEIAHQVPCTLCWLQRIFMFPQVILLGLAWWKNDIGVKKYAITLAAFGAVIAIYNYLLQLFPGILPANCTIGGLIDCSVVYSLNLGYITFAIMSLTGFALIILFLSLWRHEK